MCWASMCSLSLASGQRLFSILALFVPGVLDAKKEIDAILIQANPERRALCSKCHSVYEVSDIYESAPGGPIPKLCPFTAFPKHRTLKYRGACDFPLAREVAS